jgi:hypothetical protein
VVVDEDVYLEHFGKKGMRWGVRNKASNKSDKSTRQRRTKLSGIERVGVGLIGYGVTNVVTASVMSKTMNVKTAALAGVSSGVASGIFLRKVLLKRGGTKIADVNQDKINEESIRRVEEFIKNNKN